MTENNEVTIWVVVDCSYDEPCVTIFDNPLAANACADFYRKDGGFVFVEECPLYGSFMVGGAE